MMAQAHGERTCKNQKNTPGVWWDMGILEATSRNRLGDAVGVRKGTLLSSSRAEAASKRPYARGALRELSIEISVNDALLKD